MAGKINGWPSFQAKEHRGCDGAAAARFPATPIGEIHGSVAANGFK